MIESIISMIFEVIIYLVFVIPGALVRYCFLFKSMSLIEVIKDDVFKNGFVGMLVISVIIVVVLWIK